MDITDSMNSTASTLSPLRRNAAGKENCEPRHSLSSGERRDGTERNLEFIMTAEIGLEITGVQSESTESNNSGGTLSSSGHEEPSWRQKLSLLERELVQSRKTIRSLAKEVNRRHTKGSTSTQSWHTVSATSGQREGAEVCTFEDSRRSFANSTEGENAETESLMPNLEQDNVPPAQSTVCQLLRQLLAALSLLDSLQALRGDNKSFAVNREHLESEDTSESSGRTKGGGFDDSSGSGPSSSDGCSSEERWERLVEEVATRVPEDEDGLGQAVRLASRNCREHLGLQERVVEMQRNAERAAEEVERQVKVERELYICERKQLIQDQVIELEGVKAAFKSRDDHILFLTERIKKLEANEAREQEEPIKRKRPKDGIESRGGSLVPLRHCSSLRGLEQWVGLRTPPPLAAVHKILQNIACGEETRVLADALKERTREVLQMGNAMEQLQAKCTRLQLNSNQSTE